MLCHDTTSCLNRSRLGYGLFLLDESRLEVFLDIGVTHTRQFLHRNDRQQIPTEFERFLHSPILVFTLANVAILKFVSELGEGFVFLGKSSFAEDHRKFLGFLSSRIGSEELVHEVRVVLSGLALPDSFVLESEREGMTSTGG